MVARPARTDGDQRPFLKWAGNKYRVLPHIRLRLPPGKRLVEPFAGSGAVFLNTDYDHYLLTDTNPDLILLYNTLKTEGADFVRYCRRFFQPRYNTPEQYYALRDAFNRARPGRRKAALFVYLNRHGYNGLCRYNKQGGFNVPFGRYVRPHFPEAEMLNFHERAQHAEFRVQSFEKTLRDARKGDVVYCDPPYVPLSVSASFTSYSQGGFDLEQQRHLAELAAETAARGIPVLISNHDTPFTREAYARATELDSFPVHRSISCNGARRQAARELLALFV